MLLPGPYSLRWWDFSGVRSNSSQGPTMYKRSPWGVLVTSSAANKGMVWQLGQQFMWKSVQEGCWSPASSSREQWHPPHDFHGLYELCMLPEWQSCPRRAPGPTCWHSGVSCRVCLRDQEHKQCSPPSFLLQGMIREETRRDSKSIPDFQPGVTGRI